MDLGHGFIPRIGQVNHTAVDRALRPDLFHQEALQLPWAWTDGVWVGKDPPLLGTLREHGTQLLVDTQCWRYREPATFEMPKYRSLPHAPSEPFTAKNLATYRAFVEADVRWQARWGADAYLLGGAVPIDRTEDIACFVDVALEEGCQAVFGGVVAPRPLVAVLGVHTLNYERALEIALQLPERVSAIYVQATPVKPKRDSVSKLVDLTEFLLEIERVGFAVIGGHLGAGGGLLRSLGVSAVDAGLGEGESFVRSSKLPRRSKARDKGSGARGSRRYVRQIQRSVSSHEWQQLVGIHALRGLLDCKDRCCQFRPVETRDKSGREHSLYARVNEARELDALPPSMRAQRQLDVLSSARSTLTACNHALAQAGQEPFATEHVENQVTALERLIARRRAA